MPIPSWNCETDPGTRQVEALPAPYQRVANRFERSKDYFADPLGQGR